MFSENSFQRSVLSSPFHSLLRLCGPHLIQSGRLETPQQAAFNPPGHAFIMMHLDPAILLLQCFKHDPVIGLGNNPVVRPRAAAYIDLLS